MLLRRTLLSLAFSAAALSCGPEREPAPGLDSSGGGVPLFGVPPTGNKYPSGPYGRGNPEVGEIVEDFALRGYIGEPNELISVDEPIAEFKLSDFRSRGTYLLVHVSAFWCSTCRPEAYYLGQFSDTIREAGGEVLEILVDGETPGVPASDEELDVWVANLDLRGVVVAPEDEIAGKVFVNRDYVYIIDLETMEVVWRERGPTLDPTTTEIGALEMLSSWLAE